MLASAVAELTPMPSPFPGMNPYLEHESVFHGFHQRIVVEICRTLVPQIRSAYIADIASNVCFHELSASERMRRSQAVLPAVDIMNIPYIKIMDLQTRDVATVIEVLSRTNKLEAEHRIEYLSRRQRMPSSTNLIEIDLLRSGDPMTPDNQTDSDYRVRLSRCEEHSSVSLWQSRLKDRLPVCRRQIVMSGLRQIEMSGSPKQEDGERPDRDESARA